MIECLCYLKKVHILKLLEEIDIEQATNQILTRSGRMSEVSRSLLCRAGLFKKYKSNKTNRCICSPTRYTVLLYNRVYSQINVLCSVSDLMVSSSGASKLRVWVW
jgi:hypothetical protein